MSVIRQALGKQAEMDARVKANKATMAAYVDEIKTTGNGVVAQFGVTNANGLWLHSPVSYNGSLLKMFGFNSNMAPTEGSVYQTN
ncbi:hypothetical protein [Parasedimentitalea marina]|uniref:hypothetical protein n=1 Tax=Parasedimentitalea marina TaxID=2483033 RepID=UPI001EE8C698|nr:hypothetical protein [Parasedimentitalea marina]